MEKKRESGRGRKGMREEGFIIEQHGGHHKVRKAKNRLTKG